jgi:hypothetical protein
MASYLVAVVQILLAAAVEALGREAGRERGNDCWVERIPEEGASKEHPGEEGGHKERIVGRNAVIESAVGVGAGPFGTGYWHPFLLERDDLDQLARCYEH